LPADFEVALQGVDTRLKALQPGTTLGDIAYSSATANTSTRLPIGTTGQVLAVSGGVPAWTTTADVTPLTTKGDLFTFTTVDARLGIGANNTILTADSAEATGMKWATPASSGGMTLLSTTTLSGASTTISSINQTYQHLYVIVYGVTNATADGQTIIRANSEASIYYGTNIRNTTIGTTAGGGITFEQGSRTSNVNINAVTFWDYADTFSSERHLVSGIGYTPSNTNFQTWGGLATASAVSSLYFYNTGGNFSGGTVEIWGIK
jgi:hypothetical protein